MIESSRGVLYPSRLPSFHRVLPPPEVQHLVLWFWIPEWDLPPGVTSRQDVVAYPALNLVVEPTQVTLSGATTRATHRELVGTGWAVGALLRPAAVAALVESPSTLVDTMTVIDAPLLHRAVAAAMVPEPAAGSGGTVPEPDAGSVPVVPEPAAGSVPVVPEPDAGEGHTEVDALGDARRSVAVQEFAAWLASEASPVSPADQDANALAEVLMGEDPAQSVAEAAARLAVSERTLQRLAHRYVGVTPAAMIRRRRLQEAAARVREDAGVNLASLAAEFGYADHAHLTRDFGVVLGMAPTAYRQGAAPG